MGKVGGTSVSRAFLSFCKPVGRASLPLVTLSLGLALGACGKQKPAPAPAPAPAAVAAAPAKSGAPAAAPAALPSKLGRESIKHVIIVSEDGLRPDALTS